MKKPLRKLKLELIHYYSLEKTHNKYDVCCICIEPLNNCLRICKNNHLLHGNCLIGIIDF